MRSSPIVPLSVTEALRAIDDQLAMNLHVHDAEPLRLHDAATVLLPTDDVVVRLTRMSPDALERADRATQLTSWLASSGFPTVRPVVGRAVEAGEYVATLWHHVPRPPTEPDGHPNAAMGCLLRELHAMPTPPLPLPRAEPLARLRQALDLDNRREDPVLSRAEAEFLRERVGELAERYTAMQFPLGHGLIHNDAHGGNLIADATSRYGYVLTDWEGACYGPREMDVVLVGAPGSRFGDTEEERRTFTEAYGYDIARWSQHAVLRDIRDLHSLAAYIRTGPSRPTARDQLRTRIRSLQNDDRTVRWTAAP